MLGLGLVLRFARDSVLGLMPARRVFGTGIGTGKGICVGTGPGAIGLSIL